MITLLDIETKLEELRGKYREANNQDRLIIIRQARALQLAQEKILKGKEKKILTAEEQTLKDWRTAKVPWRLLVPGQRIIVEDHIRGKIKW